MRRTILPCPTCAYDLSGAPRISDSTIITCSECGQACDLTEVRKLRLPYYLPIAKIAIPVGLGAFAAMNIGSFMGRGELPMLITMITLALTTLFALGAPFYVFGARAKRHGYSWWIVADELLGAYALCVLAAFVALLATMFILK